MWHRIKIILIVLVVLVTIMVILQNTEQIETQLLFWPLTMPLAALLLLCVFVGFALGILVSGWMVIRRKR